MDFPLLETFEWVWNPAQLDQLDMDRGRNMARSPVAGHIRDGLRWDLSELPVAERCRVFAAHGAGKEWRGKQGYIGGLEASRRVYIYGQLGQRWGASKGQMATGLIHRVIGLFPAGDQTRSGPAVADQSSLACANGPNQLTVLLLRDRSPFHVPP